MKLYFGTNTNDMDFVYESEDKKEIFMELHKMLDKVNYKSYYTRSWKDENSIEHLDFGSHTYFFFVKGE